MKILIRNLDSTVIYAQDDLVLDNEAHGDNWRDPNFNTSNATLSEAELPNLWTGAVWSYIDEVWAVVDTARHNELIANEEAKQSASVRQARNDKLKDSDWTQIADSTADKVSWATYRQVLRDISGQAGFPFNITWPEQP